MVLELERTLPDPDLNENRTRVCHLGYRRTANRKEDGEIGWRCLAEPVDDYVAKGGTVEDTIGRKCLCSALLSDVG